MRPFNKSGQPVMASARFYWDPANYLASRTVSRLSKIRRCSAPRDLNCFLENSSEPYCKTSFPRHLESSANSGTCYARSSRTSRCAAQAASIHHLNTQTLPRTAAAISALDGICSGESLCSNVLRPHANRIQRSLCSFSRTTMVELCQLRMACAAHELHGDASFHSPCH